jgi:hypothetical protein
VEEEGWGEEFNRHIFSIYWQGHEGRKQWFHLWPLYSYNREEERTRHAFLWKVLYRDSGP